MAHEAVFAVHAGAVVLAGLRGALVDVGRAVEPGEARRAHALRRLAVFMTGRPVQAGVGRARVVDLLAGGPGEAVRTRAQVVVRRGVEARAAVLTRLVGPAVVEVLVAEDAAPVGVTDALPARAVAVAVLAARVGRALVAQVATPAVPALALVAVLAVAVHRVAALLADGWTDLQDIRRVYSRTRLFP